MFRVEERASFRAGAQACSSVLANPAVNAFVWLSSSGVRRFRSLFLNLFLCGQNKAGVQTTSEDEVFAVEGGPASGDDPPNPFHARF